MDIRYLRGYRLIGEEKPYPRRTPAVFSNSLSPYFPYCRIKIAKQAEDAAATEAIIDTVPDQRFQPVCHIY
jgi:hypothetical protein